MYKITINLKERSYPLSIGTGILKDLGSILKPLNVSSKAAIITSLNVGKHYLKPVKDSLEDAGFSVSCLNVPDDEESKCLKTIEKIYHKLTSFKMDRNSPLIALGGGVIGDITGFAASTYLRGLPYVQVPTTLLAQVDSSAGGKTGINLKEGKNLIGTFYQPQLVLIDIDCLKTLKKRDFIAGMAEVIKYGIIQNEALFSFIKRNREKLLSLNPQALAHVIKASCLIKSKVVEHDEREKGIRSILNFGHTIGHALETLTHYQKYTHGEAVAMGMVAASLISLKLKMCSEHTFEMIRDLIHKMGLPSSLPDKISPEDYLEVIKLDKKVRDEKIRFVAVEKIGTVRLIDIEPKEIIKHLT
jgi:3-dehydroquinate synthase